MTKVKTVIKKIRALGLSTFVRNPVLMDFKFLLLSPIELFCKLISSFGIKETTPKYPIYKAATNFRYQKDQAGSVTIN